MAGCTLPGMAQTGNGSEWVQRLDAAAVATADAVLRETGAVNPPIVHLLDDRLAQPYIGYQTCRPFYPGADATTAVTAMGVLPSAVGATRLVVVWDYADMCVAQELRGELPTGLVVLVAHRTGHVVRWHPMRLFPAALTAGGVTLVHTVWGPMVEHPGGALQPPFAGLLGTWRAPRAWSDRELVAAHTALEAEGFVMRWAARGTGREEPAWSRLLTPAR